MKSAAVRGARVQAALGFPTDDEREGNRESMGVIIAEIHSGENWTLKRPHPKATQDPQWRDNYTKQAKKPFHSKFVLSTRNGGKKMEHRMSECPNYTLPNLRPTHGQAPILDITAHILFYTSRE